jgi:hypothetical protein
MLSTHPVQVCQKYFQYYIARMDAILPRPRTKDKGHRKSSMNPPREKWVKLNFDGAARGDTGPAGGRGLTWDKEGRVKGFFYKFLGESNNRAEVNALMEAIKLCFKLRLQNIEVEGNSEIRINLLQKKNKEHP